MFSEKEQELQDALVGLLLREPTETLRILEATTTGYFKSPRLGCCVVVGAAGYLGRFLCWVLADMVGLGLVERVLAVDVRDVPGWLRARPELECVRVHRADGMDLESCLSGALESLRGGTMFFTASVNSRELCRATSRRVNFNAAIEALALARKCRMGAFVLTSSHNVVFDGEHAWHRASEADILSSLSQPTRHMDVYSEAKADAEAAILAGNGVLGTQTCALRPCGIFGPFEDFHFTRAKRVARLGLSHVRVVPEPTRGMDWNYVSNLVDAHILCAQALVRDGMVASAAGSRVAGRAFFIVDGPPPPSLQDFWVPVLEAGGVPRPRFRINVHWYLMYIAALCFEAFAWIAGTYPFLMRMELRKVVLEHTFSSAAATEAFGWRPRVSLSDGLRRCAEAQRMLRERRLDE
eukprot:Plantae.Rhodophyta-Rhodochaete_pulchella.ctg36135.p1 GENE.Plantae.Rhodophyta-Rhodochaete_pulchella.ctg36135~~Plantae.Rhodophyta-Rhodochaete_pulchella.ctg36135.p1  ORF type:complete len:409 (+),score=42.41 Plantae.Rhodophyta-Rhodochaete_pulchella.ctg36135:169-1395(+)